MIPKDKFEDTVGQEARTPEGEKLGTVGAVYLDDHSGEPEFATVQTGLFGNRESFVPVRDAELGDKGLEVPYDKDTVKHAPNVDPEQHITPDQERELFEYYRLPYEVDPESDDPVSPAEKDGRTGRLRLRRYLVA